MKVLHCCLAAFYIDDYSYQENILPRIHQEQGHVVEIVASTETYVSHVKRGYVLPGSYLSRDGIRVTRLAYVWWLPAVLARKLRIYSALKCELERFRPDVVFLHDCQFLSIGIVGSYAKKYGAAVLVDSHTDYINSGRSFLSRRLLHGLIYRLCAQLIAPYTQRFLATLPLRAKFLTDVYGIPREQISVLPFGADDARIDYASRACVRSEVRRTLGIPEEAIVFIAGGKIDTRKNIHTLIEAFLDLDRLERSSYPYLVVFGEAEPSMRAHVDRLSRSDRGRYVGWVDSKDIYRYLWGADVAVFPGTHSVLWEEAVGLGLPCVFQRWSGIEHVDVGGNCVFLDEIDVESLKDVLVAFCLNPERISEMRSIASERGVREFSYSEIARRSLCLDPPPKNN